MIFTFKFYARVVILETKLSFFKEIKESIDNLYDKFDDFKDEIHAFQLKNKD